MVLLVEPSMIHGPALQSRTGFTGKRRGSPRLDGRKADVWRRAGSEFLHTPDPTLPRFRDHGAARRSRASVTGVVEYAPAGGAGGD